MTINAIRKALRKAYGARKYRITANGEIHVYGPMLNSTHVNGWYLLGYLGDPQTETYIKSL